MPSRKHAAVLLAALAGAAAAAYSSRAQPQSQSSSQPQAPAAAGPAMNRNLVVLDPAHGGPDAGATLADHALEKDVTLAVAARLRAALTGAGFTVVSTRDADTLNALTNDQRTEIVNRAHAVACIVLHATGSGSGVHVYTSALEPSDPQDNADGDLSAGFVPVPWDFAQAGSVRQSLRLAGDLSAALETGNLPVAAGRAAVRPLDNLMCPAVAVEVAPLVVAGGDTTPVTDADYQQRVAGTLAGALRAWRAHTEPPDAGAKADSKAGAKTGAQAIADADAKTSAGAGDRLGSAGGTAAGAAAHTAAHTAAHAAVPEGAQ